MRRFLAVLIGVVVAFFVIMAIEGLSSLVYPPPEDLDMNDREALAEYIKTLPPGAFVFVLVAHVVGVIVGAFVCTRFGGRFKAGGMAIGGLLLLAGITNLLMIPHPEWFAAVDVLLYLPAAIVGVRLGCIGPEPGAGPDPEPAA